MGVVIVGAGLSALRTAEALRSGGWRGRTTVVGDELHLPYTRPPLTKQALTAPDAEPDVALRLADDLDVDWVLGEEVVAADLPGRNVRLAGGRTLRWDGLVVATGVRARRLPVPALREPRFVRTMEEATALARELLPGRRVVVVGAGFIGCEVAVAAVARGCRVEVVLIDDVPMLQPLGELVGGAVMARHEAAGIVFRPRTSITEYGERTVTLSDGTELVADVVVEAVGSRARTDWLVGHDLDLRDGVLCGADLRVVGAERVVATGDVARFPHGLFPGEARRIEHWQVASDTGAVAAASLLDELAPDLDRPRRTAVDSLPTFWSDQGGVGIRSYGLPGLGDSVDVVDGDLAGDVVVEYRRAEEPVAVVSFGKVAPAMPYVRALKARLESAVAPLADN